MLTKHSAADGDVQTLFLYDGTPRDRSCWRWRSHDYTKLLLLPEARSSYRAFWLVQWDVVDTWHVVQGDPDRGVCSNPTAVERQDDLRKFHSFRSPWIAEVSAAGTSSPTSDGNGLNRHRGSDARTNPRMSIPVNEKSQTSRQTQPLRASGGDSVFPTISENFTSGGAPTVDSSSMTACEWNSVYNFHYHNGDEEAVSEVLRSADAHRISEEWNQEDEIQELMIENELQVAVKRGSYHDLSRSIIERESAVLARLPHPNICNVIKISRTGLPATELAKHDLRSIIDSRLKGLPDGSTPFSWRETLDIIRPIAEGMAFLNGHNVTPGITLRDLKCQNILLHTLTETGSAFRPEHYYPVKLADFVLTKIRIQSSDGDSLMAGASRYVAPEMLEVREFPLKADVYTFGMVCYEILTGKLPFEEYWQQGLSLDARRPLDNLILRDVPEALRKLIHQCLDSNPAQRPTFDHIVMKLRECKVQADEEFG